MSYLDNGMRPNLLYGKADEAWNPIQNVPGGDRHERGDAGAARGGV
jgi:hypothetical protein